MKHLMRPSVPPGLGIRPRHDPSGYRQLANGLTDPGLESIKARQLRSGAFIHV
jgi:hypothetical protein